MNIAAPKSKHEGLLPAWTLVSIVAECVAVILAVSVVATSFASAMGAAALEGSLLGFGQRFLLQQSIGKRAANRWAVASVAGAVFGRALEYYCDIALGPLTGAWNLAVQIGGGAVLGFAVGVLMGIPQAVALRQVAFLWRWPLARGVAWAFALPLLLLGASLAPRILSPGLFTAWLMLDVATAALVAGAVEGFFVVHLFVRGHVFPIPKTDGAYND